jgi:hypothetical protein
MKAPLGELRGSDGTQALMGFFAFGQGLDGFLLLFLHGVT